MKEIVITVLRFIGIVSVAFLCVFVLWATLWVCSDLGFTM